MSEELRDAIAREIDKKFHPESTAACEGICMTAKDAADALLASEQFTIGPPAGTRWLQRWTEIRDEAAMTEERSCEEAFDAWWKAQPGWWVRANGIERLAFAAGWAARTPTLPAGAREDEARRRSAILLAFASEHHKAHGTAERVEALTWALDTLASGEDIRTWPAGDRPPADSHATKEGKDEDANC